MPIDQQRNLYALPTPPVSAPLLADVDMAAIVPTTYWEEGASITPAPAEPRLRLLQACKELSEGRYLYLQKNEVQPNYFGRAASFIGNLGSAFPPQLVGLDPDISTILQTSLQRTINAVLVDVIRYGTGLWRLRENLLLQPVLERVDPASWFPATSVEGLNDAEPQDALVAYRDTETEKWAQVLVLEPGHYSITDYQFNGTNLGAAEVIEVGTAAETRMLYPIALPPTDGEWGRSAYLDMFNLADELGKRFSANSATLGDYARPMLVVKGRAAATVAYPGPNQQTALKAKATQLAFDDGRRQPVWALPEGVDEIKFVQWDAQQQASFSHIDRVEDALFDMTSLPSGLGRMADKLASGASLRRLWAPTYVLLETLRTDIVLAIRNAVTAVGEITGIDTTSFDVEWPNPLDQLDQQQIAQGSPEDFANAEQVQEVNQ